MARKAVKTLSKTKSAKTKTRRIRSRKPANDAAPRFTPESDPVFTPGPEKEAPQASGFNLTVGDTTFNGPEDLLNNPVAQLILAPLRQPGPLQDRLALLAAFVLPVYRQAAAEYVNPKTVLEMVREIHQELLADALASLSTVEDIEELLAPLRSKSFEDIRNAMTIRVDQPDAARKIDFKAGFDENAEKIFGQEGWAKIRKEYFITDADIAFLKEQGRAFAAPFKAFRAGPELKKAFKAVSNATRKAAAAKKASLLSQEEQAALAQRHAENLRDVFARFAHDTVTGLDAKAVAARGVDIGQVLSETRLANLALGLSVLPERMLLAIARSDYGALQGAWAKAVADTAAPLRQVLSLQGVMPRSFASLLQDVAKEQRKLAKAYAGPK